MGSMRQRIRNILATGLLVVSLGFGLAAPVAVQAADTPKSVVCQSIGGGADCAEDTSKGANVNNLIKLIINILSFVVGIAAVIMIIVSGFRYITSGGDSNKTSGAKNTLVYAIIGLVVVALAQFIVQYVLDKATAPPPDPNATQSAPDSRSPYQTYGYTQEVVRHQA